MTTISGFKPLSSGSFRSTHTPALKPRFGDSVSKPVAVSKPLTFGIEGQLSQLPADALKTSNLILKPGTVFTGDLVHAGNITLEPGAKVTGTIIAGGNVSVFENAEAQNISAGFAEGSTHGNVTVAGKAGNITARDTAHVKHGGVAGDVTAKTASIHGEARNVAAKYLYVTHGGQAKAVQGFSVEISGAVESAKASDIKTPNVWAPNGVVVQPGRVAIYGNAAVGSVQSTDSPVVAP